MTWQVKDKTPEVIVPSAQDTAEQAKARNMRNIVLALGLVGFVILIFVVTLVKMGGNVANRPL
jgi:hypothetical protein